MKMSDLFLDSLRGCLVRALIHEVKVQVNLGNLDVYQHDYLIHEIYRFGSAYSYEFPDELWRDLRIMNGTQRILPLVSLYVDYLEKQN